LDVDGALSLEVVEDQTSAFLDKSGIDGILFRAVSGHGLFYASRTWQVTKHMPRHKILRLARVHNVRNINCIRPGNPWLRLVSPAQASLAADRDLEFSPATAGYHRGQMASGMQADDVYRALARDYAKDRDREPVSNFHSEVSKILYHQDQHDDTGSVVPNYHVTTWWNAVGGKEFAQAIVVVETSKLAKLIWQIFDEAKGIEHYLFREAESVGGFLRMIHGSWEPPYYLTRSEGNAILGALRNSRFANYLHFEKRGGGAGAYSAFLGIDLDLLVSEAGARVWTDGTWSAAAAVAQPQQPEERPRPAVYGLRVF
jgi:hypothetical protein